MKDVGAALRTLYSTLLAAVTYGGQPVPFYNEPPLHTTPDNYILLSDINQQPTNNDQHYVSDVQVTLDIVTKANMRIDRDAADAISNTILGVLLPNTNTDRVTADFQIGVRDVTSPGYIRGQNGSVHTVRKILIFNNHINQL